MTTVDEIYEAAMALPEHERELLADRLYDSLAQALGLEMDWDAEIARREAEHDADPASAILWDDALRQVFSHR